MTALEAMIKKLCTECRRRDGICGKEPPTYIDAHRCKHDEAEMVLGKIEQLFPSTDEGGE